MVNAILLHNLPVVDPNALVRIGDKDDCCVNGGWHDDGDYSLFSTDTYYMFKKSLPEFEELAAMESGYAWRPLDRPSRRSADRCEVRDGDVRLRQPAIRPATTSATISPADQRERDEQRAAIRLRRDGVVMVVAVACAMLL